ncbi:MAG TPA: hypothetical protein VGF45_14630, partial [Polyangia bacterium]
SANVGVSCEARWLNRMSADPWYDGVWQAGDWERRWGAGARLGLFNLRQLRLLISPSFGLEQRDRNALSAELGMGYRLFQNPGAFLQVGALGEASWVQLRAGLAGPEGAAAGLGTGFLGLGFMLHSEQAKSLTSQPPTPMPGRPLHAADGSICLPEVIAFHGSETGPSDRVAAHRIWRERAGAEWASVAAFYELAEQLAICGAPAALCERAHAAAEDELRHTFIAGTIAAALAGAPVAIAPAGGAQRPPLAGTEGFRRLMMESWSDGCLNEGFAAVCARQEAAQAGAVEIATGLRQIARDETRHAALAWDVISWGLNERRHETRALMRAMDAVGGSDTVTSSDPAQITVSAETEELARYGCLGPGQTAPLHAAVKRAAKRRLHDLLA